MTPNNDDLLESYDDENNSDYDFFQESKESTNNTAYGFLLLGFLILFGIKFVLSLTDTSPDINAIVIRQVQLLKIVEQTNSEQEIQAAVAEYDSLVRVLNTLEEE
ncbi:MAG: hypothetical protein JKY03_06300 [Aureispira sp.]|nr:hypothetical protein [Aureispira sp.]